MGARSPELFHDPSESRPGRFTMRPAGKGAPARNFPRLGPTTFPVAYSFPPRLRGRDMVFENPVLFLRDALLISEFMHGIKFENSGRIVLFLKTLAFLYHGLGRTKYASEMLILVHNLAFGRHRYGTSASRFTDSTDY